MDALQRSWRRLAWGEVRSGWRVLLGCTLGVATGAAALPFYTAGVFVAPLQHSFGWSRSELALSSMAWTASVVVCAPFVGALIDRFGVRGPASLGLLSLAGTFFAFSRLDGQLWSYVAIQVVGAALGVSSTPVAFTRAVNERFDRARGAALGFTLAGTGITAAFAPSIIAAKVQATGWRSGFHALALAALCAVPAVFLLLGKRPRGVGRRARAGSAGTAAQNAPAGLKSNAPAALSASPVSAAHPAFPASPASLRDALASSIFRRLLAAFFILALGVSGYVLHMIPMMTDAGMDLSAAARIQGALGIAVIAGRVGIGVLADHFFAPRVAAATLSVTALGMLALAAGGTLVAAPAALAIGFALGAEVDLIGYLTARYFGLDAYGRLYGILYAAFVLGTGLSPLLIAQLQATTGTYGLALSVCATLVGGAVLLFLTAPAFNTAASVDEVTRSS